MVQRDRLQEHADAAVRLRRGQAGAQHGGRVVGPGRAGDDQARDVPQAGHRVVVVEMAAEPFLVGEAGDPHHHRVAVLALGEEGQRGAPRRGSGRRRCAGRRGTGSPAPAAARPGPRPAPGRGWTARRAGCRTPARRRTAPRSPRVTPYTPPLRATSSPNTSMSGPGGQRVGQRRVDRLGQGERRRPLRAAGRRRPSSRVAVGGGQARAGPDLLRVVRRQGRHHLRRRWPAAGARPPRPARPSTRARDSS